MNRSEQDRRFSSRFMTVVALSSRSTRCRPRVRADPPQSQATQTNPSEMSLSTSDHLHTHPHTSGGTKKDVLSMRTGEDVHCHNALGFIFRLDVDVPSDSPMGSALGPHSGFVAPSPGIGGRVCRGGQRSFALSVFPVLVLVSRPLEMRRGHGWGPEGSWFPGSPELTGNTGLRRAESSRRSLSRISCRDC